MLNSTDIKQTSPRTEAVSILGGLLSLPDDLGQLSVLQPDPNLHVIPCPDVKVIVFFLRIFVSCSIFFFLFFFLGTCREYLAEGGSSRTNSDG